MGRNGRKYVQQNYRWDVILGKYEKMFARLQKPSEPSDARAATVRPWRPSADRDDGGVAAEAGH